MSYLHSNVFGTNRAVLDAELYNNNYDELYELPEKLLADCTKALMLRDKADREERLKIVESGLHDVKPELKEIEKAIALLNPDMSRPEWTNLMSGLGYSTQWSDDAFRLFDEWSSKGRKTFSMTLLVRGVLLGLNYLMT